MGKTQIQTGDVTAIQLPTPAPSDVPAQPTPARKQHSCRAKKAVVEAIQTDEDFLASDDSEDLMADTLSDNSDPPPARSLTPPPTRDRKKNIHDVDSTEDYGEALLTDAEKSLIATLRSQLNTTTRKPIVRAPFPTPILDRSPLFGATNTTILRTCFRIGEALNAGCQAVRTGKDVLLELYARVKHYYRDGRGQHFVLHDLYHDRAPYLTATCGLWDQSLGSEDDEEGTMCRVIGRMKRDGGAKWKVEVLRIWEVGWEDVEYVAGIYSQPDEGRRIAADD